MRAGASPERSGWRWPVEEPEKQEEERDDADDEHQQPPELRFRILVAAHHYGGGQVVRREPEHDGESHGAHQKQDGPPRVQVDLHD